VGDRLKVLRVDAELIAAQMVDVEATGHGAMDALVGKAMGSRAMSLICQWVKNFEFAVAMLAMAGMETECAFPHPAAVGAEFDFREEI